MMMKMIGLTAMALTGLMLGGTIAAIEESLPPLKDGRAPRDFKALWAGYDPRAEPLEVEVLKEWEEDGVIMRVVRYRIGVFKGQKAMMAAVYGFPKGASKLPGLVQIHGGGQSAHANAVFTNAKRGYATISIAWAGRINSPGYVVGPDEVKLFWEGATDNPAYKLTTDWGVLDAYHAPCRNPKNEFAKVSAEEWTLDAVESPRNNPWFLCTLAARRALTFLEQRPEVNARKLGVYGHSMGGKLTVLTAAADPRVKAVAPSCGGFSDRSTDNALYAASFADGVNLKHLSCPAIFLSPANDFHGRIDDLQKALDEIHSKNWRVTCSPHHNHEDNAEYEVATQLWFDQYLKGCFRFPETPRCALKLRTDHGVPTFAIAPDASKPILSVDIYYTQQGQPPGGVNDMEKTMARFWHHVAATRNGASWTAELPLLSTDKPLWVYGNIGYRLDPPVTGAGYYYVTYTADQYILSSRMLTATPDQLKAAGVRPALMPSLVIESFDGDWEKEWFTYKPEQWARKTHKLHDAQWQAPAGAKLALEVLSEEPNKLIVGMDACAAEIDLTGGGTWQTLVLSENDFKDASGAVRSDWSKIRELRLAAKDRLVSRKDGKEQVVLLGAAWNGPDPKFRNLRWMAPDNAQP
jgi:cephalosporin-C deacetylase-like acetyl esterase